MKIGLISTPWVAVPPHGYGGTEAMIDWLARALVDAGEEVLLFATGDSTCPVPTEWVYKTAAEPMGWVLLEAHHALAAYEAMEGVDVIHDHTIFGPLYGHTVARAPIVTTHHGEFNREARAVFSKIAEYASIVAISEDQRAHARGVPVARTIHHGICADDFPVGSGSGDYLLFLGRMSPNKGVHIAIRVARSAGMRLLIGAKMKEEGEHEYFHDEIEPTLGPDVEYLGEVGADEKLELLGSARALLNPIRWPEPFGLVMVEAFACGTPVIAFPEGAAPEIIDDGVTGYLCESPGEMVEAAGALDRIDRGDCRRVVEERFSSRRMARDYLRMYRKVCGIT